MRTETRDNLNIPPRRAMPTSRRARHCSPAHGGHDCSILDGILVPGTCGKDRDRLGNRVSSMCFGETGREGVKCGGVEG
jgi:hypothetical protein